MSDPTDRKTLEDEKVPAVGALFGPWAADILDAVIKQAGGSVETPRVTQVRYVPGKSVVVQYSANMTWADGRSGNETLIASSGIALPVEVPVVEIDGASIGVWRFPHDPFLPGLPSAVDTTKVRSLLARLGAPDQTTRIRTRAYRPGRRAVVEAVTPSTRIFLKIVRPDRVSTLQAIHESMAGKLPVPHSYGWSESLGLVAMQAMPGKTIRAALDGRARRLPEAAQIERILDALPDPPAVDRRVSSPIQRADDHRRLLNAVVPDLAVRVDDLAARLSIREDEPLIPAHGDFHSSQVLTRGSDVVGLVDVDSAGYGRRVDDLAGIIGHLSILALDSSARRTITGYRDELVEGFRRAVDPSALRVRTAAVILGLATGPFRVQETRWIQQTERRIALAEEWAESATTPPKDFSS